MPLPWSRMRLEIASSMLRCLSVLASMTDLTVYGLDSLWVLIVINPMSLRFSSERFVEVNSTWNETQKSCTRIPAKQKKIFLFLSKKWLYFCHQLSMLQLRSCHSFHLLPSHAFRESSHWCSWSKTQLYTNCRVHVKTPCMQTDEQTNLDEAGVHGSWDRNTLSRLLVVVGAVGAVDDAQHHGFLHGNLLVAARVKHAWKATTNYVSSEWNKMSFRALTQVLKRPSRIFAESLYLCVLLEPNCLTLSHVQAHTDTNLNFCGQGAKR